MRERLDRYWLRGCFTDADIEADPGTGGAKFRVDDDGTRVWPYTKLVWGGSGVQTVLSAGAAALPIQDGGNSITVDGTVTAAQATAANLNMTEASGAAIAASLSVMDDWDETNRAAVNTIAGQVGVQGAAGASTALTQRIAIATDANVVTGTGGTFPVTDSGGSLTVDGTVAVTQATASNLNATVVGTGTLAVQVDGAALTALQLIDNACIADDAAFTPATTGVHMAGFFADEASTDSVDEGDGGAARMTLDRKQIVAQYAHTTGGWTPHNKISVGTAQDASVVKATPGQLGIVNASNVNAAAAYVKFYDTAATPTEAALPVLRFLVPGNTAGAGLVFNAHPGFAFAAGIAYRITTGVTNSSTAGAAANEVLLNLGYA